VLEKAEESGLPPGNSFCSLQQVRNGALALGIIPIPDLVTGSSYFCDMGSKSDELLHEVYGHRAIYVDGSLDAKWGKWPNYQPEKVEFFGAQINKLFDTVKKVLGVEITREAWYTASTSRANFNKILSRLVDLKQADPMPISDVVSTMAIQIFGASTGRSVTEALAAIDILCQEVGVRIEKGIGVVEKGAPRVLHFFPHFSDPGVTHMMEEVGLAITTGAFRPPPQGEDKPTFATLGEELAYQAVGAGGFHSMFGMAKLYEERVKSLNVDGVIWDYLYNCRPLALGSHLIKQWIQERTGVPVLSLEMDIYDSRYYSAESLRTRVETFAEILRAKKVVK
jgi:benzoyl-CoA reductase/2-hydroxyglutaryl-CoA dehydratase subunit BcrC/BadD/HgdB